MAQDKRKKKSGSTIVGSKKRAKKIEKQKKDPIGTALKQIRELQKKVDKMRKKKK